MKKTLLLLLTNLLFINLNNAQISYSSIPLEKQLIARDISTNSSTFSVNGIVSTEATAELDYDSWASGEPNNSPAPENAAEIINLSLIHI